MAFSTAARPLMSRQPSRTIAAIRKHKVVAEASGHLQTALSRVHDLQRVFALVFGTTFYGT